VGHNPFADCQQDVSQDGNPQRLTVKAMLFWLWGLVAHPSHSEMYFTIFINID
jgi:hypothetical protein